MQCGWKNRCGTQGMRRLLPHERRLRSNCVHEQVAKRIANILVTTLAPSGMFFYTEEDRENASEMELKQK